MLNKLNYSSDHKRYLLVGLPNVGKSTWFNRLTRATTEISNFERSTVAVKVAKYIYNRNYEILDLPGLRSLNTTQLDDSLVSKILWSNDYDGIVNIININTLPRDLHLTIQLLELNQTPISVALNMVDESKNKIDAKQLSKLLNCPVSFTSARKKLGLKETVNQLNCPFKTFQINYGDDLENKISQLMNNFNLTKPINHRFLAIQLLEANAVAYNYVRDYDQNCVKTLALLQTFKASVNVSQKIQMARQDVINEWMSIVIVSKNNLQSLLQLRIDRIFLHPIGGLLVFAMLMVGVYYVTFGPYAGGYLNDKLDYLLNDLLIPKLIMLLDNINTPGWLTDFLGYGLIGGVFAILPFLPYILILFLLIGFMQQSGYLARVSVISDRYFSRFGLSGRSILNLISGIGCNVPAIMMSRSIRSRRERFTTIFVSPFISCSARATVIAFVSKMIFPISAWYIVLIVQLLSGALALTIGLLFSKVMFRQKRQIFILEIPRWRWPDWWTILKLIWLEVKMFLFRVGKFIIIGSIIIWLLSRLGPYGYTGIEDINHSFIAYLGTGLSYIFYPLGLNDWRISASLLLSFPAKELAITNLTILFHSSSDLLAYFNVARGLSFITFYTVYIPCLSTMAVINKETNHKMLWINIGCALLTAYVLSIIVYWICLI